MEKTTEVKNIKTAILIFDDPKLGDRRVVFGEPKKVLKLLEVNCPIIKSRIEKLNKNFKTEKSAKNIINATREWFSRKHSEEAFEKGTIDITYKIKSK